MLATLGKQHWFQTLVIVFVSHLYAYFFLVLPPICYLLYTGSPLTRALIVITFAAYFRWSYGTKAELTGRRFWPWFTTIWPPACHSYFPVTTKIWDGQGYTTDVNSEGVKKVFNLEKQSFVFGVGPHGPFALSGALMQPQLSRWPSFFGRTRIGAASAIFKVPFIRDFNIAVGAVDAGKTTLVKQIQQGNSIILFPGGIKEQLWVCDPEKEDVVVMKKGFVKLALQHGCNIVPVYCFGERRAHKSSLLLTKLFSRPLKKLLNIGLPFSTGRWFSLTPFSVPITIVIGKPIELPKTHSVDMATASTGNETQAAAAAGAGTGKAEGSEKHAAPAEGAGLDAAVDHWHAVFMNQFEALYEEHKQSCGYGKVKLVMK